MIERFAYLIKTRLPAVFPLIAYSGRLVTIFRFSRRRAKALAESNVSGQVFGQHGVMRQLTLEDLDSLKYFFSSMPDSRFYYFNPHGFENSDLIAVIRSRSFMVYGLFVEGVIVAYALLKLAPTGTAFIGRIVATDYAGKGVGRFLSKYLYWQASLAGLRSRSTISKNNLASLRSHQAVAEFSVIAELPNDYLLIEFQKVGRERPVLEL